MVYTLFLSIPSSSYAAWNILIDVEADSLLLPTPEHVAAFCEYLFYFRRL
jgi:hypothetical protein